MHDSVISCTLIRDLLPNYVQKLEMHKYGFAKIRDLLKKPSKANYFINLVCYQNICEN